MSGEEWRCDVCGGDRERCRQVHSQRSGRYVGEQVRWEVPEGHPIYPAGSGFGQVTEPYDGGFVWITAEGSRPIVPMEFVFPAGDEVGGEIR